MIVKTRVTMLMALMVEVEWRCCRCDDRMGRESWGREDGMEEEKEGKEGERNRREEKMPLVVNIRRGKVHSKE